MFGYVRPLKGMLPEEDEARYQAVYCGLCRAIGEDYGRIAQLFLNYDFAFLAMVLSKEEEVPCIQCRRCPVFPTRKRDTWVCDEGLSLAAAESVILSYWKLRDNIVDSGFFRGLMVRFAALALKPAYRKAKKRCPAFDETVKEALEDLGRMERENCAYLDRPADAFARILQASAGVDGVAGKEALRQMLYHVGRWIYLIDALDDLESDRKTGSYNPLIAQYGAFSEEDRGALRETMYASLGMAVVACEWLDFGVWTPIIKHIITLGLPAMEEVVLSGEWRSRKKRIIRRAGDE